MAQKSARALPIVTLVISVLGSGAPAAAQNFPSGASDRRDHLVQLDQIVEQREPVTVGAGGLMFGGLFSFLSSASVPFGFEEVSTSDATISGPSGPAGQPPAPVLVSVRGKSIRAALDAVVAADPRYEWRAVGGVVVMRPVEAWRAELDPLSRAVPPVVLDRASGPQVFDALQAALGHTRTPSDGWTTSAPLSLSFPGGSLFELLNAIAAADGRLGWGVYGVHPELFMHDSRGPGLAVADALEPPAVPVPDRVVVRGPAPDAPAVRAPLDRVLPDDASGLNVEAMASLADQLAIPFGFEAVGALTERVSSAFDPRLRRVPAIVSVRPRPIDGRGLTFRQALDAVMAADRRYEWRDVDGVVVVRPAAAWRDGTHPLMRPVPALRLHDASVSDAFDALQRAVDPGSRGRRPPVGEGPRLSMYFAGGTLFDLVNAVARAGDSVCWSLTSSATLVMVGGSRAVETREPSLTLKSGALALELPVYARQ